ncbi:hypothetical protein L0Y69_01120 [bacterium]|nr:hypothetical protein [bacterium]
MSKFKAPQFGSVSENLKQRRAEHEAAKALNQAAKVQADTYRNFYNYAQYAHKGISKHIENRDFQEATRLSEQAIRALLQKISELPEDYKQDGVLLVLDLVLRRGGNMLMAVDAKVEAIWDEIPAAVARKLCRIYEKRTKFLNSRVASTPQE